MSEPVPLTRAAASNRTTLLVSRYASGGTIVVAALILTAWLTGQSALLYALPGQEAMKVNTALCLLLSGGAVFLLSLERAPPVACWAARLCAWLVIGLAGLTLIQDLVQVDLGIDQLLVADVSPPPNTRAAGRMAPNTALYFILIGLSLLQVRRRGWGELCCLLALLISGQALLGYAYGVEYLYALPNATRMAWMTAATATSLGVGRLALDPAGGIVALLGGSGPGSVSARRLLPPILLAPLLLGWLRLVGEQRRWFDDRFGLSLMVLATMLLSVVLIWRTGVVLNAADKQRRQDEARLREAEQERQRALALAEEAVCELEALISIAAHELKNPLTTIAMQTRLLRRRIAARPQQEANDLRGLQMIEQQTERLTELINDLLDASRAGAEGLTLHPAPLDMAAFVERLAEESQDPAAHHTIAVVRPAEPCVAMGDEARLEQVLRNLLNNAMKYSPAGGRIELRLLCDSSELQVAVRDEGVGIASKEFPNLFRRFYRVPVHQAQFKGLGVGLYLVREIVVAHGGRVTVQSEVGEGSTFTVHLPRAPLTAGEV